MPHSFVPTIMRNPTGHDVKLLSEMSRFCSTLSTVDEEFRQKFREIRYGISYRGCTDTLRRD